jgi:adenylate cyclase, class 2
VDTYFKVTKGRLKLREGNIENALIYYQRNDLAVPKESEIILQELKPGDGLHELLKKALDILIIVDKRREIYFIDNVKFHLDQVEGLGNFVEIEALDTTGSMEEKTLNEACRYFMKILNVEQDQLINCSYSDLLTLKNQ